MRYLLMFSVSSLLLASCGNSANTAISGDSTSTSANNSQDGHFEGVGTFAYTINGKKVAIKDWLVKGNNRQPALVVSSAFDDPARGVVEVHLGNALTEEAFQFKVADKGATSVQHYRPMLGGTGWEASYLLYSKLNNCYAESVTVTITAADARHVAGTFYGTYKSIEGPQQIVTITDGSFDVPTKNGH